MMLASMADRSADPASSYIPWELLRDAYLAHFGPLLDLEERYDFEDQEISEDVSEGGEIAAGEVDAGGFDSDGFFAAEVVYCTLRFATPDTGSRLVLATFGAGPRTGGHEVFFALATPFPPLEWLLDDKAITGVSLAPGLVLPLRIQDTPFTAILFAPADAGSIAFPLADGGTRYALRAIPLTDPERELAGESLEKLVRALREAGVLEVVDPLRDCVVAPGHTRKFWALAGPALQQWTDQRVDRAAAHYQKMIADEAPDVVLETATRELAVARSAQRHFEAKWPGAAPAEERFARQMQRHESLIAAVFDGATKGLPLPPKDLWRAAIAEIIGLTLQTHPAAQTLITMAGGMTVVSDFNASRLVDQVCEWLQRFHPEADLAMLAEAGKTGATLGTTQRLTADGAVSPSGAWKTIVWSIYLRFFSPESLEEARQDKLMSAVLEGIGVAADIFQCEDASPPEERLITATRLVALKMLIVFHDVPIDLPPKPAPKGVLH
jgi:hypothetical protein